jgi:glycosyltransferase 2 family protein
MTFVDPQPATLRSKVITVIKFIIFFSLGILIIWLSLRNLTSAEKNEIIKSFKIANYYWVFIVVFLGIFAHILRSLRWMLFFEPMGYKPSLKNTFYAVMVGYFANLGFPRLGEVTRCGILAKYEKIPFNKGFGTVITERAVDMIVFLLLFFLMILTQIGTIHSYLDKNVYPKMHGKFLDPFSNPLVTWGLIGFLLIIFILFIIFRRRISHSKFFTKIMHMVLGFWQGLKSLSQIRKPFLFIFYTFSIWGMYFLMMYLCFFCFPQTMGLSFGAGLSALVLGSIGIMITPGGIGLYPAIIQETLLLYGISNTTGLALGWISWTAQTIMIIIVGGMSLLLLSFNKDKNGNA